MTKTRFYVMAVLFLLMFNLVIQTTAYIKAEDYSLSYSTHLQDIGWVTNNHNEISGTVGQERRLEAVSINLIDPTHNSSIEYSSHLQDVGWTDYVSNGQISGTTDEGRRLEAIKIRLKGNIEEEYNIFYRVHVQDEGWQDWVMNNRVAGTVGEEKRVEAIQIQLLPKETAVN